jgi:hypothetical protein
VKLSLHFFAPHFSHLLDYDDDHDDNDHDDNDHDDNDHDDNDHDDDDHAVDEYDVYRHRSEVDEFPSYSI